MISQFFFEYIDALTIHHIIGMLVTGLVMVVCAVAYIAEAFWIDNSENEHKK